MPGPPKEKEKHRPKAATFGVPATSFSGVSMEVATQVQLVGGFNPFEKY